MSFRNRAIAALVCFPAMVIHGQPKQVSTPLAGYVFDGSALRPISGVPGGATLGDAIALRLAPAAAEISPQLDSAIVTAGDGSLHLFRLSGNSATEIPWKSAPPGPARVAYSPSGTAAVVYTSGEAHIFSGLPKSPKVAFSAGVGASAEHDHESPGGAPAAIAVSDDAGWLLVAGQGSVRLFDATGSSAVLLEGTREVVAAFAPGSHLAAVLNGAGPTLEVFPDVTAAPSQRIPMPGLTEPVGIAFSPDGRLILMASHTGNPVTIFDRSGSATTALQCDSIPTGVQRLGSLFRITDAGAGPVWMVDMSASPPHLVFVPAR